MCGNCFQRFDARRSVGSPFQLARVSCSHEATNTIVCIFGITQTWLARLQVAQTPVVVQNPSMHCQTLPSVSFRSASWLSKRTMKLPYRNGERFPLQKSRPCPTAGTRATVLAPEDSCQLRQEQVKRERQGHRARLRYPYKVIVLALRSFLNLQLLRNRFDKEQRQEQPPKLTFHTIKKTDNICYCL